MEIKSFTMHHLIKSEDLNHHGTLYAGRGAEWFVEAGFVAAAGLIRPENIVCLKIHGLLFTRPVHLGEIICYESKIVLSGKSRLVAYVEVKGSNNLILKGFITFVNADAEGHAFPHGIVITPTNPVDLALNNEAANLPL